MMKNVTGGFLSGRAALFIAIAAFSGGCGDVNLCIQNLTDEPVEIDLGAQPGVSLEPVEAESALWGRFRIEPGGAAEFSVADCDCKNPEQALENLGVYAMDDAMALELDTIDNSDWSGPFFGMFIMDVVIEDGALIVRRSFDSD